MALARIQKLLSEAGITSRRDAEGYIQAGRVQVNGRVVTELGSKADSQTDVIKVDGQQLVFNEEPVVIMMNKPSQVMVTLNDPQKRMTVVELLKEPPFPQRAKHTLPRVYPVGRLDYDAEGLLLLTNRGDLAQQLTHPRFHVPKTYLVKVSGVLEDKERARIENGMFIKDLQGKVKKTQPAEIHLHRRTKENAWYEISVTEGRNHLIKNLFRAVSHPVRRILRIEFAGLKLGELPTGRWRELTMQEIGILEKWDAGK